MFFIQESDRAKRMLSYQMCRAWLEPNSHGQAKGIPLDLPSKSGREESRLWQPKSRASSLQDNAKCAAADYFDSPL